MRHVYVVKLNDLQRYKTKFECKISTKRHRRNCAVFSIEYRKISVTLSNDRRVEMKEYTCPLCTWKYKGDSPPTDCPVCHNKSHFAVKDLDKEKNSNCIISSSQAPVYSTETDISKTALVAWLYQACQIEDALDKLRTQFIDGQNLVQTLNKKATNPRVNEIPKPELATTSHWSYWNVVVYSIVGSFILWIGFAIAIRLLSGEWELKSAIVFAIPCAIAFNMWMKSSSDEDCRNNMELQRQYENKVREQKQKIEKIKKSASEQLQETQKILQNISQNILKLEDFRKVFYSEPIIHPVYRKREAVFVMYNMLVTGRCDTLKEAINAYEDFVWKKEDAQWKASISQQLNHIIAVSERMIWNMADICEQTHRIQELQEETSRSVQYTSEEIARNTAIIRNNTDISLLLQGVGLIKSKT